MITVNLECDRGFAWSRADGVHVKGYLFDAGNRLLCGGSLLEYFRDVRDEVDFAGRLAAANGFFAVVIEREGTVLAAVDHLRSFPLFYLQAGGGWLLGDSAEWIVVQAGVNRFREVAQWELRCAGFVGGADTLPVGVQQVQAGCHVRLTAARATEGQYYAYSWTPPSAADEEGLLANLDSVLAGVFERTIEFAAGRRIVVPLSAGHDSRLIIKMLARLGYKQVECFNYGVAGSAQSAVSRQAAEECGFAWHFVPYNAAVWREIYNTDRWHDYFRFAGNLCSAPVAQDLAAVDLLCAAGTIPPDSVIAPGHSGGLLFGRHMPLAPDHDGDVSRDRLVAGLLRNYHVACPDLWWGGRKMAMKLRERLAASLGIGASVPPLVAGEAYERWVWRERQAKFICNSMRVYEYHGLQWTLPLWDMELVGFWAGVPPELRYRRAMFLRYMQSVFRDGDGRPQRPRFGFVPLPLKDMLQRARWVATYDSHMLDWNRVVPFTRYLRDSLRGRESFSLFFYEHYLRLVREREGIVQ